MTYLIINHRNDDLIRCFIGMGITNQGPATSGFNIANELCTHVL